MVAFVQTVLAGRFDIGQFLQESNPYAWGATGIGLCIGLSVLGAGWYVAESLIMTAVTGMIAGEYSSPVHPLLAVVSGHRESQQRT